MPELNQKEIFLTKLYSGLCDFEKKTGVEIHEIKIERQDISTMGIVENPIISKYDLILK